MKDKQTEKPDTNKIRFKKGDVILEEGDDSSIVYFLLSGTLGIYKGKERVNKLNGQGMLFGEMSSILYKPRSTTVKAETDCEVKVYHGGVPGIIKRFPHVAEKILAQLATRIETMNENFSQLQEQHHGLQEDYTAINKELASAREKISELTSMLTSKGKSTKRRKKKTTENHQSGEEYIDSGYILDYPTKRKISSKEDQ